jgi:hypothetical protein
VRSQLAGLSRMAEHIGQPDENWAEEALQKALENFDAMAVLFDELLALWAEQPDGDGLVERLQTAQATVRRGTDFTRSRLEELRGGRLED